MMMQTKQAGCAASRQRSAAAGAARPRPAAAATRSRGAARAPLAVRAFMASAEDKNWHKLDCKHVIQSQQFGREAIDAIFKEAARMEKVRPGTPDAKMLEGRIMATLFYEPSTRTRLSFESAMARLGGTVLSTESAGEYSSAAKGETLEGAPRRAAPPGGSVACLTGRFDRLRAAWQRARFACDRRMRSSMQRVCMHTLHAQSHLQQPIHPAHKPPPMHKPPDTIRTVEGYADCIVLRHFQEGSAMRAAKASSIPIINAGDGPGQHPSQVRGLVWRALVLGREGRPEGEGWGGGVGGGIGGGLAAALWLWVSRERGQGIEAAA